MFMYALNDVAPASAQKFTMRRASAESLSSYICPTPSPGPCRYGAVASIHGPGFCPERDRPRDGELAVAVDVARRAHRRHAAGEIQPREALREVAVDAGTGGVVQVLVHHHEPRDHGLPVRSTTLRAGGSRRSVAASPDGRDASVAQHERLVLARGGAGAVDHAHVREHDDVGVDRDVLPDVGRELRALGASRRDGERDERERGGAGRIDRVGCMRDATTVVRSDVNALSRRLPAGDRV